MKDVTTAEAWHCVREASLHRDDKVVVIGHHERWGDWWIVRTCNRCGYVWWEKDPMNLVKDEEPS